MSTASLQPCILPTPSAYRVENCLFPAPSSIEKEVMALLEHGCDQLRTAYVGVWLLTQVQVDHFASHRLVLEATCSLPGIACRCQTLRAPTLPLSSQDRAITEATPQQCA
eukprot:CAMPEP_0179086678 /NCGR_PEP_ID=MMETSP0796-20121207/39334_1 /TAXON_ID=73915 /ORGANISM="Pyrodinium bahamense, Strain pbaha01" /LENGTH=109 /DNA_ID=CAMNT_0020784157 /DNA_START=15 /DNA_END=341 /DNA_ORIENTATION=-